MGDRERERESGTAQINETAAANRGSCGRSSDVGSGRVAHPFGWTNANKMFATIMQFNYLRLSAVVVVAVAVAAVVVAAVAAAVRLLSSGRFLPV